MNDNLTTNHRYVPRSKVLELVGCLGGQIFSVVFTKKDGSLRTMPCRMGVVKGIKGTAKKTHPSKNVESPYLLVHSMEGGKRHDGFRNVNLTTIESIKTHGITWEVM